MPRTAGSRNSGACHYCLGAKNHDNPSEQPHSQILLRDGRAIDYTKAIGRVGMHTCLHLNTSIQNPWFHRYSDNCADDYANIEMIGYFHGEKVTVARYRQLRNIDPHLPVNNQPATVSPEPVTPEPVTPEPTTTIDLTFTDPQVQPSTGEGQFDVVGALNGIFNGQMTAFETRFREVLANGLMETNQAAIDYTNQAAENILAGMLTLDERITEIRDNQPVQHNINVTVNNEPTATIEGRPHVNLETIVKQVSRQHHLWLCGPAGSGKTTAAKQAAKAMGLPFQEISCGPATSQFDLFGFITPDGRYQEGLIRKMFEEGGVLMLDEIDNTNPSVLTAMNNVLANGEATFPDGTVKRHPNFVCLAGANTYGRGFDRMYVGRNQIDAASLDRFRFMEFNYDEDAEVEWAGTDQRNWVKYVQAVRAAASERRLSIVVSPRASIFGAEDLRAGDSWEETADGWIWNKLAQADKETLQGVVRMADYQRS